MSFTAAEIESWLQAAGLTAHAVAAAGGAPLPAAALRGIVCHGAAVDSRALRSGWLFVGLAGERTHGARFLGAALSVGAAAALVEGEAPTVESSEVPVFTVEDGRSALAAVAGGYLRRFSPRVAAITGSNGKTTTKDLLRAMLVGHVRAGANPGNLNSRVGLPLAILAQSGQEEVLILEMGASAPGEILPLAELARPVLACITNIAPAHLEAFGDVAGVLETKAALLDALPADGVAVLNRDDPSYAELRRRCAKRRCRTFGRAVDADVRIEACRQTPAGLEVTLAGQSVRLPLFGGANAENLAAAAALAAELGVPLPVALSRAASAELSPHRSRLLHIDGRTLLDDCYNANPASMEAALASLASLPVAGRRIAVLGTMAELGEGSHVLHRRMLARAKELGAGPIFAVGEAARAAAADCGLETEWPRGLAVDDLDGLGRALAARLQPGDALLVKGSRSVGLERVLESLLNAWAKAGGTG